jgi:hypothetical protein
LTRRLFPYGRWQDSALRPQGLAVASDHDRKQSIAGISKTIRAYETHISLSPNRTFDAKWVVNFRHTRGSSGRPAGPVGIERKALTGEDEVRVSTDRLLVRLVQRRPSAAEVKGVGDGRQIVPGADGVRAVDGVARVRGAA